MRRKRIPAPPIELIQAYLKYNQDTGQFVWSAKPAKQIPVGAIAGEINAYGYRVISLKGGRYFAHHLAWYLSYGEWPHEIDHINRDPLDNRIANLRLADRTQNLANTGLRKDNTSGVKGVSWATSKQRWQAEICVRGRRVQLGRFKTLDAAKAARADAAKRYFGEYAFEN